VRTVLMQSVAFAKMVKLTFLAGFTLGHTE
jgi:hypothetical protein